MHVIAQRLPLPIALRSNLNQDRKYVNFILPLSGRYNTFKRFLKVYEEICINEQELTRLVVILYKNKETAEDFQNSINLIIRMKDYYPNFEINYKIINEKFSRGRALQLGADTFSNEELLFFVDVDIVFNHKSLLRIRQNTIRNQKIYFPIVFSLYNLKFQNKSIEYSHNMDINLNNQNGFWRQFGFGIVSLYKVDFVNLGGFNTSITGWGLEDVAFYDNNIKSSIKIIRTVDTGLIHIYHPVECSKNLEPTQKDMCIGTKSNIFASLDDLQLYYKKFMYMFR